jgi:hypothetical protein
MANQKSVVTLRIPKKTLAIGIIVIVLVAAILVFWQVYPILQNPGSNYVPVKLQPMNLTLIARNGTSLTLNEEDIAKLESFKSRGGFKNSVGNLGGIGNYTGVRLTDLCNLADGINSTCSLRITARDGYSMVYTYDQVMGNNFVTFNPATGDEIDHTQPLTVILAYYKDGLNLTSNGNDPIGPLRLAIVGSEGVLTESHWWVKCVIKVEIRPAIEEWTLLLKGALVENVDRATFESGVNEGCHGINWTDGKNVWTGISLWLLVGRVDDGNVHETNSVVRAFNDTLAKQGYIVKVMTGEISGERYSCEFDSLRVMRNADIIVANRLNGAPLPGSYWPLKLVGSGLSNSEMLGNIVEIQIIFP